MNTIVIALDPAANYSREHVLLKKKKKSKDKKVKDECCEKFKKKGKYCKKCPLLLAYDPGRDIQN